MPRRPASGVGLAAIVALLGAFCAARPVSDTQPRTRVAPPHASVVQLRRALTTLFTQPAIDHAQWTVRVDSLETGEPLFTYYAHRLMVPASNQKLLTAAVAAERLGWGYRFTTRLLTNGSVDASGTLSGNLYVVGDGDPSINPRHPDRWRAFDDWGAQLQAMGIRVIDGHLVGDDNLIDEPGWGEGWSWDDLQFGYGAPAGALQYNENQIDVTVGPRMTAGAPAIVISSPLGSGLLIDNQAVTAAPGVDATIDVSRRPGTIFVTVRGQIAEGAQPVGARVAVDNPTQFYLNALREALGRHNVFVGGSAIDIDDLRPQSGAASEPLRELIVDRSPPLSEVVDVMLKWSRNGYAETLLTALSPLSTPGTSSTVATAAVLGASGSAGTLAPVPRSASHGLAALQATLDGWGITPTAAVSRDGSGLSRMDYLSADGLVRLLTRVWTDPAQREPFRAALPQAGVSGTLATRLKDTRARGRVWAKTGSMSNIRTLSGYVETTAGEALVFSLLVNNFVVPAADIDAVIDAALLRLIDLPRR